MLEKEVGGCATIVVGSLCDCSNEGWWRLMLPATALRSTSAGRGKIEARGAKACIVLGALYMLATQTVPPAISKQCCRRLQR